MRLRKDVTFFYCEVNTKEKRSEFGSQQKVMSRRKKQFYKPQIKADCAD